MHRAVADVGLGVGADALERDGSDRKR